MKIGERIRNARKHNKEKYTQAQLAEAIGVHEITVRRWEKGERFPDANDIDKIASFLKTSRSYLIGDTDELNADQSSEQDIPEPTVPLQMMLPVIDQEACAGDGFVYDELESVAIDWMPFPIGALGGPTGPRKPFFVRVSGDSMIGAKIYDGSFVAVNPNLEILNGNIVYAKWMGRCSIKGFIDYGDRIELRPANRDYKSTWIEEGNYDRLEILGKVVRVVSIDLPENVL